MKSKPRVEILSHSPIPVSDLAGITGNTSNQPWFQAAGDGYRFLITAEQSGGKVSLWHATVPAGGGPPPHIHEREEEFFYVLRGTVTFFDDGDAVDVIAGQGVRAPLGSRHWFCNRTNETSEMLILVTPSGIEELFRQIARPWDGREESLQPMSDEERMRLKSVAPEFGIVLG